MKYIMMLITGFFALTAGDLKGQTVICPKVEQLDVYQNGGGYTASVKNATGTYSFSYSNIDGILITHFTATSQGSFEIEVQQRFMYIVISRTIIARYITFPSHKTYNYAITGNHTAKATQSIVLDPGTLIDGASSLFITEIVDCPDPFRLAFNAGNDDNSIDNNLLESDNTTVPIYPNPVSSGKVNFGRFEGYFQVFNSKGVMVLSGNDSDGFEVDPFEKGIYFVRLGTKTQKLIIQ